MLLSANIINTVFSVWIGKERKHFAKAYYCMCHGVTQERVQDIFTLCRLCDILFLAIRFYSDNVFFMSLKKTTCPPIDFREV